MVSYQAPLNDRRNMISENDNQDGKNLKRKWDSAKDEGTLPYKHWKTNPKALVPKSFSDIELHLETPLPSEWQRCLDIQSGEIHFYNTRTQKRTVRDPRESSDPSSPPRDTHHMSLDLQLNLPCASLNNHCFSKSTSQNTTTTTTTTTTAKKSFSNSPPPPQPPSSTGLFRSLQTAVEKTTTGDNVGAEDEAAEMVATACKRCHMLVMLCKSSPTCPNCKYVHPPCQNLLDLFSPRLSLSC